MRNDWVYSFAFWIMGTFGWISILNYDLIRDD